MRRSGEVFLRGVRCTANFQKYLEQLSTPLTRHGHFRKQHVITKSTKLDVLFPGSLNAQMQPERSESALQQPSRALGFALVLCLGTG